jgi:hypothetical protein
VAWIIQNIGGLNVVLTSPQLDLQTLMGGGGGGGGEAAGWATESIEISWKKRRHVVFMEREPKTLFWAESNQLLETWRRRLVSNMTFIILI